MRANRRKRQTQKQPKSKNVETLKEDVFFGQNQNGALFIQRKEQYKTGQALSKNDNYGRESPSFQEGIQANKVMKPIKSVNREAHQNLTYPLHKLGELSVSQFQRLIKKPPTLTPTIIHLISLLSVHPTPSQKVLIQSLQKHHNIFVTQSTISRLVHQINSTKIKVEKLEYLGFL